MRKNKHVEQRRDKKSRNSVPHINKYNDYLKKYPNDSKKYYIMFNNQLGNYISNKALDTDAADVFEKLKFEANYGKNSIKPIDINYWKRKIVNEDYFNY